MSDENGYCIHGKYVGGCMIDHICGLCEDGLTVPQKTPIWIFESVNTSGKWEIVSTCYSNTSDKYAAMAKLTREHPSNIRMRESMYIEWERAENERA